MNAKKFISELQKCFILNNFTLKSQIKYSYIFHMLKSDTWRIFCILFNMEIKRFFNKDIYFYKPQKKHFAEKITYLKKLMYSKRIKK